MRNNKMGERLVRAFSEKLVPKGQEGNVRPDLFLSDWEKIDRNSASVMICWGNGLEVPNLESVDNYVINKFGGNLKLNLKSLKVYPKENLVTATVKILAQTRRLKDADDMLRISPTRYMESKASGEKQVWEVQEDDDGNKHLIRVQANNLEEILEERRRALKVRKANVQSFSKLRTSGYLEISVGDRVKFYHNGLLKDGKVERIDSSNVNIRSGKATLQVIRSAIVDMVQKDPDTLGDQKDRIREYWMKILGKEYVDRWLGQSDY